MTDKTFQFWKEDCQGYVTKKEHGGWHLWDELGRRLEQEFGHPFTQVNFSRTDWLEDLWFHPTDTPRPREDWSNQAQLWFSRDVESQTLTFGLMIEHPTPQWVQEKGYTSDRDVYRMITSLEHDAMFARMLDGLIEKGLSASLSIWHVENRPVNSAAELRQMIEDLDENQGWSVTLVQRMSCAEAVELEEAANERIMQVYRQVWPLLVQVWPANVRQALSRKVVLVGAAAENSVEKSAWLESARDLLGSTGKVASWWSYNPDRDYVDRLRESLPSWLYISYGGEIARRGHIVDFVGPGGEPIESPWPEHTLPEERGKTDFEISATGKEHQSRMWFLLDGIEPISPPLHIDDFKPVGEKYQIPGPKNFAFVYEPWGNSKDDDGEPSPISSLSGYLAAFVNHHLVRHLGEPTGGFGFFEVIDDYAAAERLLDTACEWLRRRDMTHMRGPTNFTDNERPGVLIDGADCPPVMLEAHTPPYYKSFLERYGMHKHHDLFAWRAFRSQVGDELEKAHPELFRVADVARRLSHISFRRLRMDRWDEEIATARYLFNATLADHPNHVPLPETEFRRFANQMRPFLDPDLALFAEADGKPVGFCVAIPDINRALIHLNGRLFPLGWLKLRYYIPRIDVVTFKLMGILREYRRRGIDALLYVEVVKAFYDKGYAWLDGSVTSELNPVVNLIADRLGAERYKHYRMYRIKL